MDIKDKVVIITGASSGIGEAAARLLASKGAKVGLVARSEKKLRGLERELPGSFAVVADMTDFDAARKMVETIHAHYGRIDILVNNAGRGGDFGPLEHVDIRKFRDLMELNVYGLIVATQAAIPFLREAGGGAIVNIGSGTTKMVMPGMSVYPSTKHVVQHISRVSRLELAKDNISVTVVHPYLTATNFFNDMDENRRNEFLRRADPPQKVAEEILRAIEEGMEEIDMSATHRSAR
jgi:short-subunit dehydrogenase